MAESSNKLDELQQLAVNGQFYLTIISKGVKDKITLMKEHIEAGAQVNDVYPQYKYNTPLHIATGFGETDVVTLLLENGATCNKPNIDNKTPLDIAIELGDAGTDIRRALIERGAISMAIAQPMPVPSKTDDSPVATEKKPSKKKEPTFPRRPGTSGAGGQLYESKMLCLVFHRAINIEDIIEFYLGSNINGIGDLDDVCLKYKIKVNNKEKTIYLFLQAKHRDDIEKGKVSVDDLQSVSGDFSYAKYFNSFLKIIRSISPTSTDVFFKENIKNVECNYVLYTSAKDAMSNRKKPINDSDNQISEKIHELIATGSGSTGVFRFDYDEMDIDVLTNIIIKEDMKHLAKKFLEFVVKKKSNEMMTDEYIKKYHVILATSVINITRSITDETKFVAAFRHEFFYTKDDILFALKETMFTEIVMIHNKLTVQKQELESHLNQLIHFQSAFTVSNLIGGVVVFDEKTHRLKFVDSNNIQNILGEENYEHYKADLQNVQVTSAMIKEAVDLAALKKLLALQEVPIPNSFGNKDMTVSKSSRIGFIIDNFLPSIVSAKFDSNINKKVVEIDEQFDKRMLPINGGLGGAVGNVFEQDAETKMLMFSRRTLYGYAKQFMTELAVKLPGVDLNEYRIKVNISDFPRISLLGTEHDMSLARNFLDRLYIYSHQGKELDVEKKVKNEIDSNYNADKCENDYLFRIHTDAIFARFHDDMQKWWMKVKQAEYLTKKSKIFEQAKMDVVQSPLLTLLNLMSINKFKKTSVEFHQGLVDTLRLDIIKSKLINIITNANTLTAIKVWQYLKTRNEYTFIDFEYVSDLPANDYYKMMTELKKPEKKTLVILHENLKKLEDFSEKLKEIVNHFKGTQVIIISSEIIAGLLSQYFPKIKRTEIRDNSNNLLEMTAETRKTVLAQTQITFQGVKVSLDTIIDESTQPLVTSEVLDRLLNNLNIEIGLELSNAKYNAVKEYYQDRQLKRGDTVIQVSTLKDLESSVVVVTGVRSQGKHTLLTHMALQTKVIEPNLWISRINLWDHTDVYSHWQIEKTKINLKEALSFLCKASLKNIGNINIEVNVENGVASLKNTDHITNSAALFEIQLFIDFFNKGNVIFLFYGFDEICPHYTKEVINLLSQLESSEQRFWVTSCPYNTTKNDLEREFGTPYTLEPLTTVQQEGFFERFWKTNLQLEKINYEQFNHMQGLLDYFTGSEKFNKDEEQGFIPLLSMGLHIVFKCSDIFLQKKRNWQSASAHHNVQKQLNTYTKLDAFLGIETKPTQAGQLPSTPLHMYVVANYFKFQFSKVGIDLDEIKKKVGIFTSISGMYECFLESNLKHFCLEQGLNPDDPDFEKKYDTERTKFMEKHKKIALFAIYKEDDINKIMDPGEITEVKDTIKKIETGQEESGIVSYVVNGAPRFVHLAFAEYFAVEYLTDLLKASSTGSLKNQKKHRAIWDFIVNILLYNSTPEVRSMFDYKIKTDPKLAEVTGSEDCRKIIFELMTKQSSNDENGECRVNDNIQVAFNEGLKNITSLFLKFVAADLNEDNLPKIVQGVRLGSSALRCLTMAKKDLFNDKVFEKMQTVDESQFRELLTSDSVAELPLKYVDKIKNTQRGRNAIERLKRDCDNLPLSQNLVELGSMGIGIAAGIIETVFNDPYSDDEPEPSTSNAD